MFRECVELIAFRRVSALGMDSTVSLLLPIGESSLSHLYFHIFTRVIISNKRMKIYCILRNKDAWLTRRAWISSWLKRTIYNKIQEGRMLEKKASKDIAMIFFHSLTVSNISSRRESIRKISPKNLDWNRSIPSSCHRFVSGKSRVPR